MGVVVCRTAYITIQGSLRFNGRVMSLVYILPIYGDDERIKKKKKQEIIKIIPLWLKNVRDTFDPQQSWKVSNLIFPLLNTHARICIYYNNNNISYNRGVVRFFFLFILFTLARVQQRTSSASSVRKKCTLAHNAGAGPTMGEGHRQRQRSEQR